MKTLLIGIILSISFVSLAQASQWVYLGGTVGAKPDKVFADRDSVRNFSQPDSRSVWVKYVAGDGSYVLDHVEYLRTSSKFRILSQTKYSATGDVTKSLNGPYPWDEYPPDSVGEVVFNWLFSLPMGGAKL
jgi:hypothetical protein